MKDSVLASENMKKSLFFYEHLLNLQRSNQIINVSLNSTFFDESSDCGIY